MSFPQLSLIFNIIEPETDRWSMIQSVAVDFDWQAFGEIDEREGKGLVGVGQFPPEIEH